MGKIDLNELEQLAAQATPGPWEVDDCNNIRIAPKGRPIVATICDYEDYLPRMADAQYIVAACNAVPSLIVENRALRERSIVNSGRAFYLADFIADRNLCAFCPVYEDCPKGDSMCKAECIGEIHKWADKQAAKEAGNENP